MPVPYLPLHILSMLSVIHTARGEAGMLAERLPHWIKGMSYPGGWRPTPRQLRRWRLLYRYWQDQQQPLLRRSIRRQHLDDELARQLRELTPLLAPPETAEAQLADPRIWTCSLSPFPWREYHGIVEPLTISSLAVEARIPAFKLSSRNPDSALVGAGNRAIGALGMSLTQSLGLVEGCLLAVDAMLPEELRLRDESLGLPLALAALKELCGSEHAGLAAAGGLDLDGLLLPVPGFEHPYGKLEACFDAGLSELYLPWGTRLYDLPKAGICLEERSKGHFSYFFEDAPADQLQVYWLRDLPAAIRCFWGERREQMRTKLRAQLTQPQENAFDSWDALAQRIDRGWPDWLAVSFRLYFELFRELSAQAGELQDWQDLMRQQAGWIHLWLRYLLELQASGLWLGRQPLEELWPTFPDCCQADASLYLLWRALQQICQLEQKGPLPFRHMHQWLSQHQTGWGLLLNQLIQLESAAEIGVIQEGMRYNMLRLMELLKSAEFMFNYPLYGVLEAQPEASTGQVLGVQYQGRAVRGLLSGGLPVGTGGLYLEDPRTRTRFQLPFMRLCPQCSAGDVYAPLVWAGRSVEQGLCFEGCEHATVYFSEDSSPLISGLVSAYGWSTQPWTTNPPQVQVAPVGEDAVMACVLHSELIFDTLITLQDPQQMVQTYERMIHELLGWLRLNPKDPRELILSFSDQALALVFVRHPESALAFALALHQLASDYNRRQTVPSAHLQIRSGLDIGWVRPLSGRTSGPPLRRSLWLAQLGQPGQLLASEAVRAGLTRVSPKHRQLFQFVGSMAENGDRSEGVYTVYTRTAGVRRVPAGLTHKARTMLVPSQLETMPLVRRTVSLVWLGLLGVEIPELAGQDAETASAWLEQLQALLTELSTEAGLTPVFVPASQGLLVVLSTPVNGAFRLGQALLQRLQQSQPEAPLWRPCCAVHIGMGELKGEGRGESRGKPNLRGPARARIQSLLESAEAGQLLCDSQTRDLLTGLMPELADQFKACEGSEPVFSYQLTQGPPVAAGQPAAAALPAETAVPAASGSRPPLAAVMAEARKLAKHRLEDLLEQYKLGRPGSTGPGAPARMIQNHLGMLFQLIRPGHFTMGSPKSEAGRIDDETPHLVVLTRPFYMLTTTVNQKQWGQIMGQNPAYFRHPDLPVESVSWLDVQAFITRLNALGHERYRLPTEAEWEYCCRAGSKTAWCFGTDPAELSDYAWYEANAGEGHAFKQPHPVATRRPNAWGLYDVHGNVWEWVNDWYGELPQHPATNPGGPAQGEARVIRGGRWNSSATSCRCASRSFLAPDQMNPGSLGFRLVMETN